MASLSEILQSIIFSNVPSNLIYQFLKYAWEKGNQKPWVDIYYGAYEKALEIARPHLEKYLGEWGEIALDKRAFIAAINRDLGITVQGASYGDLKDRNFVKRLASALAKHEF